MTMPPLVREIERLSIAPISSRILALSFKVESGMLKTFESVIKNDVNEENGVELSRRDKRIKL